MEIELGASLLQVRLLEKDTFLPGRRITECGVGTLALGICVDVSGVLQWSVKAEFKHTAVRSKLSWEISNMLPVRGGLLLACGDEPETGMLT